MARVNFTGDAVYMKVQTGRSNSFYMYEVATGKLWPVSRNPVTEIDIDIAVRTAKPSIY